MTSSNITPHRMICLVNVQWKYSLKYLLISNTPYNIIKGKVYMTYLHKMTKILQKKHENS